MTNLDDLKGKEYLILAFETSCDETAVAVTRGNAVLSSAINSQIDIHKLYGGVVPEIASRNHALNIDAVTKQALLDANVTLNDISAIAVTWGAGLLGALLIGVCYAKGLSYALNLPLVPINHIKGHIAANFIAHPDLKPPFICLLASGGHTEILRVTSFNDMQVLGATKDDAAGEAFDKVARVLSLPYPGGPQIEALAKEGKPTYILPNPLKNQKNYDFSFSGIKTAVINLANKAKAGGESLRKADLAASFQDKVATILCQNAIRAAKDYNLNTIALAGGVGANGYLREMLKKEGEKNNLTILLPPKHLCTDNAAMIGVVAYHEIENGIQPAPLNLDANPSL